MKATRATRADLEEVNRWLAARGMKPWPPWLLSGTGYVVPGVAAQWLYLTDSGFAFLENLASNPAVARERRSAGLDAVIEAAISEARAADTRVLTSYVRLPHVQQRLERHGFRVLGSGLTLVGRAL